MNFTIKKKKFKESKKKKKKKKKTSKKCHANRANYHANYKPVSSGTTQSCLYLSVKLCLVFAENMDKENFFLSLGKHSDLFKSYSIYL